MKPLKTVKVTPANIDNVDVRQLYETAFPVEEQISYDDIKRLVRALKVPYTSESTWTDKWYSVFGCCWALSVPHGEKVAHIGSNLFC